MTLAVFDIDGTICDTQEVESRCFSLAVEEILGIIIDSSDWSRFAEPTSSGIIRELGANTDEEQVVKERFVSLLAEERVEYPGDFSPICGVLEFIKRLCSESNIEVAIATGGFDSEAAFKLECCGLDLTKFANATSSDTPRRVDIIPLAIERAGYDLNSSIVYFGDAPWDVRACETLQVPMIGIGRRVDELRRLGVEDVFRDYSGSDTIFGSMLRRAEQGVPAKSDRSGG